MNWMSLSMESRRSRTGPQLSIQENTTLVITFSTNVSETFSNQELGGTILDITLTDSEGEPITQLDTPLVICLELPNNTKLDKGKRPCLSYYDERKSKWRCEDECLTNPGKDSLLCGQTDHLTITLLFFCLAVREEAEGMIHANPRARTTL